MSLPAGPIETLLQEINIDVNTICRARNDVHSLLRYESVLDDDTKAAAILASLKLKVNTAAAHIATLTAVE